MKKATQKEYADLPLGYMPTCHEFDKFGRRRRVFLRVTATDKKSKSNLTASQHRDQIVMMEETLKAQHELGLYK